MFQLPLRSCLSPAQGAETHAKAAEEDQQEPDNMSPTLASFLSSLQLDHLIEVLEREQITLEILAEMGHEDLKQVCLSCCFLITFSSYNLMKLIHLF